MCESPLKTRFLKVKQLEQIQFYRRAMDLIRRLHIAIQKSDQAGIQAAVAAGADMDHVWGMQGTALCQAITTGNVSNVILLLELGCDVNAEDFDGGYPLSLAIRKHQSEMALVLMSVPSCDLNVLDPVSKQRPLCSAVMEGLSDVVEAMVQDQRCNITQANSVGNSALHLALLHKQENIIKILARCEGFRFLNNFAGHAPVHIVAALGDCDSFSILYPSSLHAGETFHRTMAGGDSKEEGSAGLTNRSTAAVVQRELNQQVIYTGDTALHLAVREKHSALAHRLIDIGCAIDVANNNGQSALLLACAADNTDLAIRLLKSGARPNLAGHIRVQGSLLLAVHSRETSLTPLHIAASANNIELVKALCEYGAEVNKCDNRGRSPLYVALLSRAGEVAMHMLSQTAEVYDAGCSLLHAVSQCESHAAEITTALLDRGCSFNQCDYQRNLPLHEALCWGNTGVVRVLLERGASPSARGELGTLPLMFAARTGLVEMASLLLRAGADVNGADRQDDNYLHYESEDEDWSPFREALESENVDFARYLVQEGCDLSKEKYLFKSSVSDHHKPLPSLDDSDDSDSDDSEEEDGVPHILKRDKELFDWLQVRARNPHSLMQISLDAVRRVFRQGNQPFTSISGLPLPKKFIAKLLYQPDM